jgi:hypothetical protein
MTKTMNKTMTMTVGGLLAAAFLLAAGSAQADDAAYCSALVQKYERHLVGESKNRAPASLEARQAVEQCKAGDSKGIPALEKALSNAKISLPPRS